MDYETMLQNALHQHDQVVQERARLERIQWALQGQIELLRQFIDQQQALQAVQPAQEQDEPAPVEH